MANTIGTAYIQIEPSTEGISNSISGALTGDAEKAGKSAGGILSSALGGAAKIGVAAIAGTTVAMGAFGKASVDAGMDFDSSMSQVAATMGYSTAELADSTSEASKNFQQLRDFAQQMGSTTAFSATESADALNYMALAGYDAETSMKMLPNVLNLAAAGGIDLASASDMITDAQSALGLSLDETSIMADQMAAASSKSNTSVAQLGDAYLKIGANARSLSGGTGELATALGILADNGIKGAEGGTHLRNIMMSLNPTTDKAVAAWETLGVSAYDAQGNLRPLEDTFGDLNDAMSGMTDQQKTTMLSNMFNKTDLASVNALLGTQAERWDELGSAIDDSADAAQNMADVQLDNLSGDITLFQSALEGAKIAVSDSLTPTLREFVQFGSESVSKLSDAFKEGGLTGAMDALGEILSDGLAMVIEKAPEMVEAGMALLESLGKGLMDNLPTLINSALQIVEMLSKYILENLPKILEAAIQIIVELAKGIGQALPELIPTIVDVVLQMVDTLIDNIDLIIDAGIELIVGLALGLVEAIPKLVEKAPIILQRIVEALVRNAPKILAAALEIILALANGLIKSLPSLILKVPLIISAIVKGLIAGIKDIMSVGKDIVGGLWEGIKSQWDSLIQNVLELGGNLVEKFKGLFKIGSPSKLFRDEVGRWIPEGIAVGIEGNTDALDESMKTMQSALDPSQFDVETNYSANYNPRTNEGYEGIISLLNTYLPQLANTRVVLDTGATVGALAPAMNGALGKISMREGYR